MEACVLILKNSLHFVLKITETPFQQQESLKRARKARRISGMSDQIESASVIRFSWSAT